MKFAAKRFISIILVIVMCMQALPVTVFAALIDNDPEYNEEILDALTDLVGSEDEAERYYALLDHYGLLDEDGNLSESWEIWMDGEQVTLEDIIAELESEDCDLDKYVLVDGTAITLRDIQTILEIEEYIAYLRALYYNGSEWTTEHTDNLASLMNQIENEGILFTSGDTTEEIVWPSGYSHEARVSVETYPIITWDNDTSTNESQGPERIFDGRTATKWYSTAGVSNATRQEFPLWVQIELAEAVTVGSYGIVTGDDRPERDPYTWNLYGSDDGKEWTELDAQTEYTLTETRCEEETFTLSEEQTFSLFRLEILARQGGTEESSHGYGVQMSELNFYDTEGNRISLESNKFRARLHDAVPGQTVSFTWGAHNGSQQVSGDGTITMTADENGEAEEQLEVTLWDSQNVRSNARLIYFIKCDNLEGALFENGYPNMTLYGYTEPTVSDKLMTSVKNAGSGFVENARRTNLGNADVGTRTVVSKSYSFNDTEDAAYGTAIDWGVLNNLAIEPAFEYSTYLREFTYEGATEIGVCKASYEVTVNGSSSPIINVVRANKPSGEQNEDLSWTYYNVFDEVSDYDETPLTSLIGLEDKTVTVVANCWVYAKQTLLGNGTYTFSETSTERAPGFLLAPYYDIILNRQTWSNPPWISGIRAATYADYVPGHHIPIVVNFTEPVKPSVTLTLNGTEYTSLESLESDTYTNVLTYMYEVKQIDDLKLWCTGVSPFTNLTDWTVDNYMDTWEGLLEVEWANMKTPYALDAITDIYSEVTGDIKNPMLYFSVGITDEEKMTEWISTEQDEDGNLYIDGLTVSIDGGETMYNLYFAGESFADGLYANIPLEVVDEKSSYVAELFQTDENGETKLLLGKYAAGTHSWVIKYITEDDLSATVDFGGYDFENEDEPVFYVQGDMSEIKADLTLSDSDFSFGDTESVAVYGTPEAEEADFVWRSTNPAVASVDINGNIIPTGASGTTQITITARNGGYEGKAVTVAATYKVGENSFDTLRFVAGTTPFLTIPQDKVKTVDGKNAVIYWSSNISDKNAENETVFNVAVTHGGNKVYTATVSGNAETLASFAEIPGEYLIFDYMNGNNTYDVTVSVEYEGITYSDTAEITVEALPASVALGKLDSYYITDTVGTLPIEWSVEHLNRAGETDLDELFIFNVMRNNEVVEHDVVLDLDNGSDNGVYNLPITDFAASKNEPGSYREVYTVTIQAKNGADSTWSYDSFLLYVYDEDALKIMVDGEEAGDTLLMSNIEAISNMTQAEILELERDIYLKNIISINYGDYAWTEVADQIVWASENSEYASINYQQGIMYENIEDYSYTSYRPTIEFGLNGHYDGKSLVSAIHKLTGMEDTVDVTVETLEDKLYLFKFYPKAKTKLEYKDVNGEWQVRYSDENGEAAIYEENGIHSNVYCASEVDGITYVGTYYHSKLETGEGNWTKLERYPLNNLNLRRTGYTYLYIKNDDGTPYVGDIIFRGGVYVNGEYIESALFGLNSTIIDKKGNEDNIITLDETGKLSVYMNTEQWNLEAGDITSRDEVEYVFEIRAIRDEWDGVNENSYYPILYTIDATYNADDYVGSGSAVISFRYNNLYDPQQWKYLPQQHIAMQRTEYTGYAVKSDVFGTTGKIGPNNNFKEALLTTSVMWWGTELSENEPDVQLKTEDGKRIAASPGQYEIKHNAYPFTSSPVTNYTVWLNETTMDAIDLKAGKFIGLHLDLYGDGKTLSRHEVLPFKLTNLIGVGNVQEARTLPDMLKVMGSRLDTNDRDNPTIQDPFVEVAMGLIDNDSYSTGDEKGFCMKVFPTSDPTKFIGFIEANIGKLPNEPQIDGFFTPELEALKEPGTRVKYTPGLNELMLAAKKKTFDEYIEKDVTGTQGKSGYRNISPKLSGYAESLIYYNDRTSNWEIQVLNGGFEVGMGVAYTWTWNYFAGPVPVNIALTIGGTVEVGLDTLGVSYFDVQQDATLLGTDFLTELRIYLYLRFFAGIGFDYSVVAFKLGIYGQISLDMRFQWLNRPYMDVENDIYNVADGTYNDSYLVEIPSFDVDENGEHWIVGSYWESPYSTLDGQRFKLDGQIGLQLVMRFLFFSFEKVLLSFNFNLFDETTGDWELIQSNWEKNKAAQMEAISGLLGTRSLTVSNSGGQQMFSLNLAPTLESRDYLENGSYWNDGSVSLFALDETNALKDLQYNSYPYANPVITDDGAIVAYLSDMGSENVEDTRASFALRNEFGMYNEGTPIDTGDGYGDAQVAVAGKENFAVAAWTRQMETVNKDAGAVINASDQMIMMNSSEIYAGVYNGNEWITTRLTDNQQADMAPVVAANGSRAVVAWRNAASSAANKTAEDFADITNFTEKDVILYRIYDGTNWSDTYTLYNGTSGAVKGISMAMLEDGTAAVTYTLDTDDDAVTAYDRDVYYAVIDNENGDVKRNVRATLDAYLDENPQITTVTFPNGGDEEYFVLGWFSQQAVASDTADAMSDTDSEAASDILSDVRLMAFDGDGIYAPLLPDSISRAADAEDVEITSNFRFVKNASTINDLSIVWVQRAGETSEGIDNKDYMEKDALKGIKFYTFGQNSEMISFTSAIDIAEMSDGTLIDHFDVYVSDPSINEVKAVILGTTYGADGVVTKIGEAVGGEIVQYAVPSSTTSMYTATEVYQDKIEVTGVLVDYETVKKGSDTEITFIVKNKGIHAVSDVEITLNDGKGEAQTKAFTGLNILPGSSVTLYTDYYVPTDEVVDVTYSVHATFNESEGASGSAETTESVTYRMRTTTKDLTTVEDTVYLDIPELQIASAQIIEAKYQNRKILIKLNNGSDASLAKDGRAVKISFYSDSTCESPIDESYIAPIVIDDPTELAMIDEGGYSTSVTFILLNQYVAEMSDYELDEIPENGISVYIKAEALEENDEGEYIALPDLNPVNNHSNVLCETLWDRSENDVKLSYILTKDTDGCNVYVTVQNMRLSKRVDCADIVVKLYDEEGNLVGFEQFYTAENGGFVNLSEESSFEHLLSFEDEKAKTAVMATVEFAEFEVGEESNSNSRLAEFSVLEIPEVSIDDFVLQNDGTYLYSINYNDSDSITVSARTESVNSTIMFQGDESSELAAVIREIALPANYSTDIIIHVSPYSGTATSYILRVNTAKKRYTVTVDANGGSGTSYNNTVTDGDSFTLPECTFTAPEGFKFKAWSVDGEEMAVGDTIVVTKNTTVSAVWIEKEKYTVFFNAGIGTGTMDSIPVIDGESVTLPACTFTPPEKHEFKAWNVNGVEKVVGSTVEITEDTIVTAIYSPPVKIEFVDISNGETEIIKTCTVSPSGEKVTAPDMPVKKGHIFEGWYTLVESSYHEQPFDPNEVYSTETVFYAKYTPFELTVEKDGDGYTAFAALGEVKEGAEYSWHICEFEGTTVTPENAQTSEGSRFEDGKWIPSDVATYFELDVNKGDVLIVTPDDAEDFEDPFVYDADVEFENGSWIITFKQSMPFYLSSYNSYVSTPVSAMLGRYVAADAVDGETEESFSSGTYGKRYAARTEFSDGTIVTSQAFKYDIKKEHTVTFVDYDGTELAKYTVEQGYFATAPTVPVRDGYVFIGWDKAFDYITDSIVVTALYEEKQSAYVDTAPQRYNYNYGNAVPFVIESTLSGFTVQYSEKDQADWSEAVPTNAGTYDVRITRDEDDTYKKLETIISGGLVINPKKITRPTEKAAVTYTGNPLTYAVAETDDYTVTNGVQTNANEDGYNVIIALKDKENTVWDDGTATDLIHKFIINRKAIESVAGVPDPVAEQTAQTNVSGENYSGAAKWNPDVTTFGYFMAYDVTLTLTANANYKFADTITLDGYSVSSNNGTTLVLIKTFDKTAKAKITSVTAPTVDKLAVYGTLEDAISVMPNTVIAVTEAGNTTLPIVWAVVGEYDKTPAASNIFKWTASVGDYDANGQTLTGNITVENADAAGVVNTGTPAEITYDGSTYDVSTMFTTDTNAGKASYEIVVLGTDGEGTGTLGNDGKTLTVTKAGVITVKMTTAANGAYAQGTAQTTLTVKLGTGVGNVTIEGWTYGENANTPVATSNTNGTDNVTYLYESTDDKGYNSNVAPTTAGAYKVTATFAATDLYVKAEDSAEFTILKATPDVSAPTNLTATYGDTIAGVQLPEGWEWNVTDTAETVGDAGENRFSVIYTHPEDPDNYNQVTDEVTIAVSPKEVTATVSLDAYSFVYSGSEHKPSVTVKDGEAIIPSGEYTVSYTNNVNVGTATVSITDVDGGNYTVSGSTSFEITKKESAAIPGIEREFIRTVASAGNEINIEEMLPDDHGNVSYRLSDSSYTVLENVLIGTDGKLVFDTKTSDTSASDTVTVVVEMQNYTDATVSVSVILNEKTTQSITGVSAAEGLVYNEKAQQGYTGTPTSEKYTGAYEITYTGRNNSYNSTTAPTDAGDYTVTFKIPDSELYYSGNVSINFTIAKAKAEISVDTAPIVSSYGEQLTLPNATTNFGTVTVGKASADMTEVGEYTVTYTVADNENYNGDTKTVKVTIVPKKITRPAQASAVTYTGDALIYAVIETDDYTVTNGVQTNANEDGYNVIIALKDKENTVWDDGTVTDLTHKFIINRKAIESVAGVPAPVAEQTAQTDVNGENYSGAAKWNPDVTTFGYFTAYDVTLTLTANANYKFADTITLDGYSVSSNNGTTLVLTKTFDKTAKAKITSVTAPTVDKLAVYGTLEDALSVMPNTVIAVTEAGNTTLPIVWAVVGEYDKTPAASNIFKWTASVGDYDANGQTLTGDITVENADAIGVVNTGTPAEITYDGSAYDVSTMFTTDTNAGKASYEIVVLGTDGEGTGTLGNDGKTLTVTKAGVITVKMTTAANGAYAQGTAQTTLTVKLGTGVGNVTIEGWTYGENANTPVATSNTNGTDNVTYLYESTDDKGYNSNVAPTTAGAYKVTATFAATDLYVKAEDSAEFTIEKALPTVKTPPTASRVKKGNLLSVSTLTGGEMAGVDGEVLDGTFAWKSPETEMNTRGNIEVTAVFTPNDTVNYKTADVTLTVEVYTTSTGGSGISVITYYDVKFNTNGGSSVPAQSIRRNSTANEPQAPTKDGYTFEGWYTDAQYTKAYDFGAKVTKDITLYAKWSENKPIVPDECDGTKDDNCPSIAYSDLDTKAWYHLDVDYALEKGLMNGMGEGIFAPDGKLSRAMLVTILWRLEGKPVVDYLMTFEDVEAESWYTEAVRWAASEGIVLGHSAESFAPNDDITREQLATIIYRYEKYKGGGFTGTWMFRMDYADLDDVSEWSYEAMCWCTMNSIVNGKPGKLLDPLGYATRAEAAAMLHRYCENDK